MLPWTVDSIPLRLLHFHSPSSNTLSSSIGMPSLVRYIPTEAYKFSFMCYKSSSQIACLNLESYSAIVRFSNFLDISYDHWEGLGTIIYIFPLQILHRYLYSTVNSNNKFPKPEIQQRSPHIGTDIETLKGSYGYTSSELRYFNYYFFMSPEQLVP